MLKLIMNRKMDFNIHIGKITYRKDTQTNMGYNVYIHHFTGYWK